MTQEERKKWLRGRLKQYAGGLCSQCCGSGDPYKPCHCNGTGSRAVEAENLKRDLEGAR